MHEMNIEGDMTEYETLCASLGKEIACFYYPNWFKTKRYFKQGKRVALVDSKHGRHNPIVTYKKSVPHKIRCMTGGWI